MDGAILVEPRGQPDTIGAGLPDVLAYVGEFGPELVLFLPFMHWLSRAGALRERRIATYAGMACFYDDLDCAGLIERTEVRRYVAPNDRPAFWPVRSEHTFDGIGRPIRHVYPDLRRKFAGAPLPEALSRSDRPIAVVHNKFNSEWGGAPQNHLSLDTLDRAFTALCPRFQVVYIRHHVYAAEHGFSADDSPPHPYDDASVLARHPEVLWFDDLLAAEGAAGGTGSLNRLKNAIYSRCHHFITSQGGGAHHIALFSGSIVLVMHRAGNELSSAYADGYYNFMARPAPLRLICRGEAELVAALPTFAATGVIAGHTVTPPGSRDLLVELSPWTAAKRSATFP